MSTSSDAGGLRSQDASGPSSCRPAPYYDDGLIQLYHGDALEILPTLDANSCAGVVTDPPYCSGGRQQASARSIREKNTRGEWFNTDNMGSDSYIWWLRQAVGELYRICTQGSHLYMFTDWRQYANVTTACETKGWTLRSVVVWDKMRGGAMGSFWRSNHEWCPVFSKGPPRPTPTQSYFNTWHGTKPQTGSHPTEKPVALMEYLIQATSEGTVIDPFAGSGTTLRAAKDLGRPAIGIELEEAYCEVVAKKLAQEVLPF